MLKSHTPLEVEKFFPSIHLYPECGQLNKLSQSEMACHCGCGFVADVAMETGGLGITGMRERAILIGGSFEIISEPGRGTRISFQVKVGEEEVV